MHHNAIIEAAAPTRSKVCGLKIYQDATRVGLVNSLVSQAKVNCEDVIMKPPLLPAAYSPTQFSKNLRGVKL